jgi:hypothetical protein
MVAAFTIATDGSVQKIKMVQMIDSESAIEMIRVLNECPKWKPASRGGKPISVEIKYPMTFTQKSKPDRKDSKPSAVSAESKFPTRRTTVRTKKKIQKSRLNFPAGDRISQLHQH